MQHVYKKLKIRKIENISDNLASVVHLPNRNFSSGKKFFGQNGN